MGRRRGRGGEVRLERGEFIQRKHHSRPTAAIDLMPNFDDSRVSALPVGGAEPEQLFL